MIDVPALISAFVDLFAREELRQQVVTLAVGSLAIGLLCGYLGRIVWVSIVKRDQTDINHEKISKDGEELGNLRRNKEELEERCKKLDDRRREVLAELRPIRKLKAALDGGEDELWKLYDANPPEDYPRKMHVRTPRVITVMNLKGGVGKTTTVANLTAYFCSRGKRVLAIDFDYQGSLTRMMLQAATVTGIGEPIALELLGSAIEPNQLLKQTVDLSKSVPNARLASCSQTFDRLESRLMLRWLLGEESDDVRYRLARVLTDPEVIRNFDIVLIDAPPRMSMGAVNALCASHAILVPTVLDVLSAEAVGRFMQRTNRFRELNMALNFAGVVGTMQSPGGHGKDAIANATKLAKDGLGKWNETAHMFDASIRYFVDLAQEAGNDIGYLRHKNVREAYDALGDEVCRVLQL